MSMTTSQLRNAWDPPCNSRGFITLTLHGGGRVTVDPRLREAVNRLNEVLVKWDYRTRAADTGAYNCRKITGGVGYSLHAHGIALDLNWKTNPYGRTLVTDMPLGMVNDIRALRTNNDKNVWEWGGLWGGNKDAMHYEIDCAPADLATGIKDAFKPRPPPELGTDQGEDMGFIVVHGVGLFFQAGQVLFKFQNWDEWNEAQANSKNASTYHIGESVAPAGRQWLVDRLNEQHDRAVGKFDKEELQPGQ